MAPKIGTQIFGPMPRETGVVEMGQGTPLELELAHQGNTLESVSKPRFSGNLADWSVVRQYQSK
jgi:hypothetical protein